MKEEFASIQNIYKLSLDKFRSTYALAFEHLENLYDPMFDLNLMVHAATDALGSVSLMESMCGDDIHKQMIELGLSDYPPWLISLTSKGDFAVETAFKWSKRFKNYFELTRPFGFDKFRSVGCSRDLDISIKELLENSAPFVKELRTHELEEESSFPDECRSQFLELKGGEESTVLKGLKKWSLYWRDISDKSDCIEYMGSYNDENNFIGYSLRTKKSVDDASEHANIPYWIAAVPENIIKEHNDIFNENVGMLIGHLLTRTSSLRDFCANSTIEICIGYRYYRNFARYLEWPSQSFAVHKSPFTRCGGLYLGNKRGVGDWYIDGEDACQINKESNFKEKIYISTGCIYKEIFSQGSKGPGAPPGGWVRLNCDIKFQ